MTNRDPRQKSLRIPAAYEQLRSASLSLREMLVQSRATEDTISNCELILQELLTNIVDHAYLGDASQSIYINLVIHDRQLIIETQDTGVAADVNLENVAMPDPLSLQEGGYGIAIIVSLADEILYRRENQINIWKLVKQLA